jgi:hypothetical protein
MKGRESLGTVMSNCDGEVEDGAEEALKREGVCGEYTGWNFFGYVWWEDDQFKCLVLCYQSPQEVVEAKSLKELMTAVSNVYGHQ